MLERRIADLTEVTRRFIAELQRDIRVEKVFLFGSYANHCEHDYSDIDIAVISPDFEGGTERDYLILGRAALKVHPLIEARPYRPEDLMNLSPVDFLAEIVRTGLVIHEEAA